MGGSIVNDSGLTVASTIRIIGINLSQETAVEETALKLATKMGLSKGWMAYNNNRSKWSFLDPTGLELKGKRNVYKHLGLQMPPPMRRKGVGVTSASITSASISSTKENKVNTRTPSLDSVDVLPRPDLLNISMKADHVPDDKAVSHSSESAETEQLQNTEIEIKTGATSSTSDNSLMHRALLSTPVKASAHTIGTKAVSHSSESAVALSSSLPYADTSSLGTALIMTEDVGRPRDMRVFVIVVRGMINYYSGGDGYRGSCIFDCVWNGVGWMKGEPSSIS